MSPDDPIIVNDAPDEPVVNPVLVQVAELRANGRSWKATAADLGKPIEEIKRLAGEDRPTFRKLLSASRKEMIEDAFAESVVVLRRHIRKDKDHKDAAFAATVLVKLWMTIVRHRSRPQASKAERAKDERNADLHRLADYIGGMSKEEKRKLLDEEIAAYLRRKGEKENPPEGDEPDGGAPAVLPKGPGPQSPTGADLGPRASCPPGAASSADDRACRASGGGQDARGPRNCLPMCDRPARDVDVGVGGVGLEPAGGWALLPESLGDLVEGLRFIEQDQNLLDSLAGTEGFAIPGSHLAELHARRPLATPVDETPEVGEHEVDPLAVAAARTGAAGREPAIELPEEPRISQRPPADRDAGAAGLAQHPVGIADAADIA